MIKAIIFDCFGVLAGSGFKEIYRQAGGDLPKDSEFLDEVISTANQGYMSSRDMHQKVADRIGMTYNSWYDTVRKGELPNEDLFGYITKLKQTYKIAILSNANVGTMQRKFSQTQLALFDAVVVSAEVGYMKPDAKIFQLTADRLDVKIDECVFTDDSKVYCQAAQTAGMQAIWYRDFDKFKLELDEILSKNS